METSPSASTRTSCASLNACPSSPHRPFAMANPRRELLKKDNTYVYMCGLKGMEKGIDDITIDLAAKDDTTTIFCSSLIISISIRSIPNFFRSFLHYILYCVQPCRHRLAGLQEAALPLAQSPTGKVASPIRSSGQDSSAVAGAATTASGGDAAVAGSEDGGRRSS
ncbi:hypothetical protein OsJ_17691 [Oryza sativa Japonica Group]|uniref:Uncharacterized protein n=1 Tax=Oryza sativa subsp. japonica TaxID=39947 RepID=B9FJA6_ORYSJ|nr:hypothetical protein OsJ_17691 [Oryza sativa Japonica Group]